MHAFAPVSVSVCQGMCVCVRGQDMNVQYDARGLYPIWEI